MPQASNGRSSSEHEDLGKIERELEPQTLALQFIAVVLLVGAASMLGSILVPFVLALILAIAMSPLVSKMEKHGVPTTVGSLACMLGLATVLALTLGLMVYQAGSVLQNSDKYIQQMAQVVSRVSGHTGGDQIMQSLGLLQAESPRQTAASREAGATDDGGEGPDRNPSASESSGGSSTNSWASFLRRNLQTVGQWVVTGLGGLLGFLAGLVVFLAFLFYMLQTRADWTERLTLAFARLGLRPRIEDMRHSQKEIEVFVGFVSLVAFCYMVVGSIAFWLIGLPQPLLWGILTGLLEFIPFFGPTIAGALITLVALTLGSLWQPLAVLGFFGGLHLIEGYIITPMVYGSAVKIDPVTVLLGILFFGWVWGPLGSMLAMPSMILIRGLIVMTPDTPALDVLADVEQRKEGDDRERESSGAAT